MKQPLEFDFELDPKSAFEGMVLAGRRVFQGRGKWLLILLFVAQSIIMPLGFIALYVVTAVLMRGELPQSNWLLLVFGLLGGVFGILVNRVVYQRMAGMVCASSFGRGGRMTFEASGVRLATKRSEWRTGWADVEEVLIGKRSLSIAVSGIVLILPLSAFADTAEMQQVFAQVTDMFEQGRSEV